MRKTTDGGGVTRNVVHVNHLKSITNPSSISNSHSLQPTPKKILKTCLGTSQEVFIQTDKDIQIFLIIRCIKLLD